MVVVVFDLMCLVSTFYWKEVYATCQNSDFINYMIIYLVVPYMFLGKDKTIKIITQVIKTTNQEETSEQQMTTTTTTSKPAYNFCVGDWLFYIVMFWWGIQEFKVSCVGDLKHYLIYYLAIIITIISGFASVGFALLVCCAGVSGHVRYDPNERYREYQRMEQV
jgi:hypothetical protein